MNIVDLTYIEGHHDDCSSMDLTMLRHQDAIVNSYIRKKQQNLRIGDSTSERNDAPEMEAIQKSLSVKRVQSCSQQKSKKRIMVSDQGTYSMAVNSITLNLDVY